MKQFFYLTIVLFFIVSCKKEIENADDARTYIENVKASLRDSLSSTDYNNLDFAKAVLSKADSVHLYFLRISFNGKKLENDFVLLQTSKVGEVQRGKIVHLEGGRKRDDYGISCASAGEVDHPAPV